METSMSAQIPVKRFKKALFACLDETFSNVRGIYLDKGTTLFETLEGVSAEEASRAISTHSATIAAQVEHIRFYLDVLDDYMRTGEDKTNNWREIWETVRERGCREEYGRSDPCPRRKNLGLPFDEAPGRRGGCDPGAL